MYRKCFAALAFVSSLTFAGAANTYHLSLYQPTVVNGTTFKPGDCKLELNDNRIVLKQGKNTAEAAVTVENSGAKFNSTTVGYTDGNRIQEIRLGGTNTKLLFGSDSSSSAPAGR